MESWRPSKLIRAGNLGGETDISGITSHTTAQMQRNADDGLSRTPLSDGGASGRTTCSRKLGQTDRINNRVSQTDGEGGVSEQRECTSEGGSKAHKNRAGMAQREILDCAQILRSFTDWFQRSFVDSHIGCTCGNYTTTERIT